MGALIGSALALGQDTELIKNKILAQKDLNAFSFENFNFFNESLIKREFLSRGAKIICEEKSFSDLQIPFACVATNLENGEEVVFDNGALEPAIVASASLPLIFPPVFYRDKYLVDGAVRNNFPAMACRNLGAKKIIVISIVNNTLKQRISGEIFMRHYQNMQESIEKSHKTKKPSLLEKKKKDFSFFTEIFMQSLDIAAACCYEKEIIRANPDLFIPVTCEIDMFEFSKIDQAIEIGRKAALDNLDKIKALIAA